MCSHFTEDLHESSNKQPAQHNCNEFCTLNGKNVGGCKWKGSWYCPLAQRVRTMDFWFAGVHQLQRRLSKLLQETCMWCWWDGCEGGVIQFVLVERLWIEAEACNCLPIFQMDWIGKIPFKMQWPLQWPRVVLLEPPKASFKEAVESAFWWRVMNSVILLIWQLKTLRNSWKKNGILNNIKSDLRPDTIGFQECDSPELLESRTHLQVASKFEGAQGISVKVFVQNLFETFYINRFEGNDLNFMISPGRWKKVGCNHFEGSHLFWNPFSAQCLNHLCCHVFWVQRWVPNRSDFWGIMVKPRRFRILSTGSRDLEATGHWGTRQGTWLGVGVGLFKMILFTR